MLVSAPDFEGASRFYGDVLGFPVQEQWEAPDGRGTLFSCAIGDRPWAHRSFEIRDPNGLPFVFFTPLSSE